MSSIYPLLPGDKTYPASLGQLTPAPDLFIEGNTEVLSLLSISIVGSRAMSDYGERVLRLLVPGLCEAGLAIVSGLAYGVDSCAHRLALQQKASCVAVLGSGLDHIYPAAHYQLYRQIIEAGGCAVSQYPPGTHPQPRYFPERNRIIAGLSPVVLIVEAGKKSGTLSTARHALESGREVCVVPGDIMRSQSEGVLSLLKQGAHPVSCVQDILDLYGSSMPVLVSRIKPALTGSLATLYDLISCGVDQIDALAEKSGLSVHELHGVLSVLELDGFIYSKGAKWLKIS